MRQILEGIRVLDLTRVLAGPWATQMLADLGAEVIKVERPGAGDDTRRWGPPWLKDREGRETNEAAYYLSANRGKKSLTLDIAHPDGQAIARELAAKSDVVVENFKVGDLKRYGLDYAALRAKESAPGVLLHHRIRPGRSLCAAPRLRLHDPGHGRPHEHHRRARRPAWRRPAESGRGGLGSVHRPLRLQCHRRRPLPPRAHRRGPVHRHGPARLPGGHARQHEHQLSRLGCAAGAARQRTPIDRPLPGVPRFRRVLGGRCGQRRAVRSLLRRHRGATPRGGCTVFDESAACEKPHRARSADRKARGHASRGAIGWRVSKRPTFPADPSRTWRRSFPTSM